MSDSSSSNSSSSESDDEVTTKKSSRSRGKEQGSKSDSSDSSPSPSRKEKAKRKPTKSDGSSSEDDTKRKRTQKKQTSPSNDEADRRDNDDENIDSVKIKREPKTPPSDMEEREIVLSCSEDDDVGNDEDVEATSISRRRKRSMSFHSESSDASSPVRQQRSEVHRPAIKREKSPTSDKEEDQEKRNDSYEKRNESRERRNDAVNQLDRPRARRGRSDSREKSRDRSRSRSNERSRDRRGDRNSTRSKVYRVEWDRGRGGRDRRDDRRREDDREHETERRRREREKRHAEREQQEQRENKRKRSPARAPSEEGELAGPANDDDLDYLRAKKKKTDGDNIMTRTGGAYIPPARLRMMQEGITDKSSQQFQRIAWEALKKSINGLINKVNVSNLVLIVRELLAENVVRGRGLLARAVITAQQASPTFTHVYAALVAIINTKSPQIGELVLKRLVLQFKKSFRRNDKAMCLASVRFIAHLVNQQVTHEIIALEILILLLQNPTDDSVEVAVGFLQEVGQKLGEVSPKALIGVFERLRQVLHEAQIEKRTQYMIEVMFQVRKDGFKDHPAVISELDLIDEDDQFTHTPRLEDAVNGEDMLNVFKFDPDYEENEEKYKALKKEILDEDSDSGSDSGSGSSSSSDESDGEEKEAEQQKIMDMTETNLVSFRRTVYLTIQSSLDFEECAHKLLRMDIKPGWEMELCNMMLDCCGQQRTYEKFFGLLAQRFCMIDRKYVQPFMDIFTDMYTTVHRLETNKLRNVGKFFSHLLHTDAISWQVLQMIRLTEDDTTSSSRIFIKVLFQDLSEYMGLSKLNERLTDPTLSMHFEGLFPRDSPKNTRFAINFFTSIGLGGLTDELRAHLKTMPKPVPQILAAEESSGSSSSSSSSSSDDSSSSSDSSSDSDSSSSEEEKRKRKKKKKQQAIKKEAKTKKSKNKKKAATPSSDSDSSSEDEDEKEQRKRAKKDKAKKKSTKKDEGDPRLDRRDRRRSLSADENAENFAFGRSRDVNRGASPNRKWSSSRRRRDENDDGERRQRLFPNTDVGHARGDHRSGNDRRDRSRDNRRGDDRRDERQANGDGDRRRDDRRGDDRREERQANCDGERRRDDRRDDRRDRDSEYEEMLETYRQEQDEREKKKKSSKKKKKEKQRKRTSDSDSSNSDNDAVARAADSENEARSRNIEDERKSNRRQEKSRRDEIDTSKDKYKSRDESEGSDNERQQRKRDDRRDRNPDRDLRERDLRERDLRERNRDIERRDQSHSDNRRKSRQDSSSGIEFMDVKGRRGKAKGKPQTDDTAPRDSSEEETSRRRSEQNRDSNRDDSINDSYEHEQSITQKKHKKKKSSKNKEKERRDPSSDVDERRPRRRQDDVPRRHDSESENDNGGDKENRRHHIKEEPDQYEEEDKAARKRKKEKKNKKSRDSSPPLSPRDEITIKKERYSVERETRRRRSVERSGRSRDKRR